MENVARIPARIEIEAPQHCRGLRPRFPDDDTEHSYRLWRADRAVPFVRVAMYASVVGWLAFAYASLLIGDRLSRLVLPAAVFLVAPLLVGLYVLMRRGAPKGLLPAAALTNMIGGTITVLILRQSGLNVDGWLFADVATATVVLYVYYACTIMRLPPLLAALAIGPYVAVQQVFIVSGLAQDSSRRIAFTAVLWIAVMSGLWLSWALERVWRDTFEQDRLIEAQRLVIDQERERSEKLLHSILPMSVAAELKARPGTVAETHDDVTVLFADVVGFTPLSSDLPADELVSLLNVVFSRFDELSERFGVEKIKTIGDAYMAAAGLPAPRPDHAEACANLALAMSAAVRSLSVSLGRPLDFRIGMHCGPVVAGVIGTSKFAYDLWGDTVNIAARMESHGLPGSIQITPELATRLAAKGYAVRERGPIDVKGKGEMVAWFLDGPPVAADSVTAAASAEPVAPQHAPIL